MNRLIELRPRCKLQDWIIDEGDPRFFKSPAKVRHKPKKLNIRQLPTFGYNDLYHEAVSHCIVRSLSKVWNKRCDRRVRVKFQKLYSQVKHLIPEEADLEQEDEFNEKDNIQVTAIEGPSPGNLRSVDDLSTALIDDADYYRLFGHSPRRRPTDNFHENTATHKLVRSKRDKENLEDSREASRKKYRRSKSKTRESKLSLQEREALPCHFPIQTKSLFKNIEFSFIKNYESLQSSAKDTAAFAGPEEGFVERMIGTEHNRILDQRYSLETAHKEIQTDPNDILYSKPPNPGVGRVFYDTFYYPSRLLKKMGLLELFQERYRAEPEANIRIYYEVSPGEPNLQSNKKAEHLLKSPSKSQLNSSPRPLRKIQRDVLDFEGLLSSPKVSPSATVPPFNFKIEPSFVYMMEETFKPFEMTTHSNKKMIVYPVKKRQIPVVTDVFSPAKDETKAQSKQEVSSSPRFKPPKVTLMSAEQAKNYYYSEELIISPPLNISGVLERDSAFLVKSLLPLEANSFVEKETLMRNWPLDHYLEFSESASFVLPAQISIPPWEEFTSQEHTGQLWKLIPVEVYELFSIKEKYSFNLKILISINPTECYQKEEQISVLKLVPCQQLLIDVSHFSFLLPTLLRIDPNILQNIEEIARIERLVVLPCLEIEELTEETSFELKTVRPISPEYFSKTTELLFCFFLKGPFPAEIEGLIEISPKLFRSQSPSTQYELTRQVSIEVFALKLIQPIIIPPEEAQKQFERAFILMNPRPSSLEAIFLVEVHPSCLTRRMLIQPFIIEKSVQTDKLFASKSVSFLEGFVGFESWEVQPPPRLSFKIVPFTSECSLECTATTSAGLEKSDTKEEVSSPIALKSLPSTSPFFQAFGKTENLKKELVWFLEPIPSLEYSKISEFCYLPKRKAIPGKMTMAFMEGSRCRFLPMKKCYEELVEGASCIFTGLKEGLQGSKTLDYDYIALPTVRIAPFFMQIILEEHDPKKKPKLVPKVRTFMKFFGLRS